jgi:Domain of unknown function (DUF1844)
MSDEKASSEQERNVPLPPASIISLVTMLGTQVMAALGEIPDPDGTKMPLNLSLAKHFIDTLEVLEEKTRNNLQSDESAYLTGTLYQLRLAYVDKKAKG